MLDVREIKLAFCFYSTKAKCSTKFLKQKYDAELMVLCGNEIPDNGSTGKRPQTMAINDVKKQCNPLLIRSDPEEARRMVAPVELTL